MGDSVSAIDIQFKMLDNLYESIEKDIKEMNNENKDDVVVSVGKFILSCYQLKTQVYVSHMRHENDEIFTDSIDKIDELIKKGIQYHQIIVDYKDEKEKFSREFTDSVLKYLCDADDKPDPLELLARYLNRKKKYYGVKAADDDNTPYDQFMKTMGEAVHRHQDFSKSEQDRERMYMTMEYKDGSKLIMYSDETCKMATETSNKGETIRSFEHVEKEKPLKVATIVFDDDSYEDILLQKDLHLLKKFIKKWIHSDVKTLREYLPSNWRYTM